MPDINGVFMLNLTEVAERRGVTYGRVVSDRSNGAMPEPDLTVGRTPLWLPETIDAWEAKRPGHGWAARPEYADVVATRARRTGSPERDEQGRYVAAAREAS